MWEIVDCKELRRFPNKIPRNKLNQNRQFLAEIRTRSRQEGGSHTHTGMTHAIYCVVRRRLSVETVVSHLLRTHPGGLPTLCRSPKYLPSSRSAIRHAW
jgi:hypothetical protein